MAAKKSPKVKASKVWKGIPIAGESKSIWEEKGVKEET